MKIISDLLNTYRDKGGIALETFCVVFTNAVIDMRIYDDIELRDIAIFANNVTISFLQTIIENPAFFERKVGIKKQKRLRIIKDLESLKYIEYTDVENSSFLDSYHRAYISSLKRPINLLS